MSDVALRRALRTVAVLIAVFGFVDPAVTAPRAAKASVSVVAEPGADSALVARVTRDLASDFTVITRPFAGADASVLVGERVASLDPVGHPVFAVVAAYDRPRIVIERIETPAEAPLAGAVPVTATVHVTGARGRTVSASLGADRAARRVSSDDERITIRLAAVPTALGALPLGVAASVGGSRAVAHAMVNVRDRRWNVLFHDGRPSYMSTFVRRAIERDARFAVASRVVTSRGLSSAAGSAPAGLGDAAALDRFDLVVVGAPDALTAAEVSGLEAFLRRRAGGALLLYDAGAARTVVASALVPIDRLLGVSVWGARPSGDTLSIAAAGNDSVQLRGSEFAWPVRMPFGATTVAYTPRASAAPRDSLRHAVIWRTSVGAGDLLVSTVFDAWRYRAAGESRFDEFWRALIADAAARAVPALTLSVEPAVATPGELVTVRATRRDASPSALLVANTGAGSTVRLWPTAVAGTFEGTTRAPSLPGSHEISANVAGASASVPMVVRVSALAAGTDRRDLLAAWVGASRGALFESNALAGLPDAVCAAISAVPQRVTWYPMRSPWWIVAFALALSAEWWLRRGRGLA